MDAPHLIIFSNDPCPRELMAEDRWMTYSISSKRKTLDKVGR
jgi:hypothetical protein